MVAKANKTAGALPNMTAMVADAQNLQAFGDNSFDVVCNKSIPGSDFFDSDSSSDTVQSRYLVQIPLWDCLCLKLNSKSETDSQSGTGNPGILIPGSGTWCWEW